ncbi:MAG TPA: hypothetical protein PK359_11810 [Burkholderiaceae bacterium]|nr:hypothetical protein [Burkholderiaceae bacterium]
MGAQRGQCVVVDPKHDVSECDGDERAARAGPVQDPAEHAARDLERVIGAQRPGAAQHGQQAQRQSDQGPGQRPGVPDDAANAMARHGLRDAR